MSFFDAKILLGINFNEILAKKSSILIVYKLFFVCYNDTVVKTAWAYSGLYVQHEHNSHLFEAKYQSYGINHAQTISCYAFLFYYLNIFIKSIEI